MARSKLAKKMAQTGGVANYIEPTDHKHYETDEELMEAAFEAKSEEGTDGGTRLANANKRNSLMREAGFDFFDIDDLVPNDKNSYSIDDSSIEALASLIYESKVTTPLVLRATPEGFQIIDGERRYRAHKKLAERYGNRWRMVPARCFPVGKLTDEDAEFILHAENIGQRAMTPSERAEGFKAVRDRLVMQRENDPKLAEQLRGRKIADVLAEQFGVSTRTAEIEYSIGDKMTEHGKNLYDEHAMTKKDAYALSQLEPELQEDIYDALENGRISKEDLLFVAKNGLESRPSQQPETPKLPDEVTNELLEALEAGRIDFGDIADLTENGGKTTKKTGKSKLKPKPSMTPLQRVQRAKNSIERAAAEIRDKNAEGEGMSDAEKAEIEEITAQIKRLIATMDL